MVTLDGYITVGMAMPTWEKILYVIETDGLGGC